jgi:hypothetical protein
MRGRWNRSKPGYKAGFACRHGIVRGKDGGNRSGRGNKRDQYGLVWKLGDADVGGAGLRQWFRDLGRKTKMDRF